MTRSCPRLLNSLAASLGLILALSAPTSAQSLYGLEAVGGAALPRAVELVGPSAGPCLYPNGPFGLPPFGAGAGACPGPAPFLGFPGPNGDIAINKVTDTVWVAGVGAIGEYDVFGGQVGGVNNPLAGAITSLGFDSAAGRLWVSDGLSYARVVPGCGGVGVDFGPVPNPAPGMITDIDWDPVTNTLWACFSTGMVANFAPGGAVICSFNAGGAGLGLPLVGLAVDTSTPNGLGIPQLLYVTDGLQIAKFAAGASCVAGVGIPGPPTFPFPRTMWPVPGNPISGLAYAAHGVTYGAGNGPQIIFKGQSTVAAGVASVSLSGALPGSAGMFINFAGLCPPGVFRGLPLMVFPVILIGPIAHGGSLSLPVALPAGTPIGIEVHMQWFNKAGVAGAPVWESTPGLVITTSRP
jgi:hypothetical protein